jgi:group I intron endonuclease
MIGIYKITSPKGRIYVGQSNDIKKRWEYYTKLKCNQQRKIYNSLKKYGIENHKFEIIEECDLSLLNEREIYWGNFYNSLSKNNLNLKLGNSRGKISEETRQKMSNSQKGKIKGDYHTNEFKNRISKIHKGNKYRLDILHTEDTKNKIGIKNAKPKPEGFRDIISKANIGISRNKGKKHTQETKDKLSESIKSKKSSYIIEILKTKLNRIKDDYIILSTYDLAKKYNVSIPTMLIFLKNENIYKFRKNYNKNK